MNRANLLSIIATGGLGATSSGLQLSTALNKPAGVGIGAGAFSAGLALFGIRAQKGDTSHFDFQSNMLAEFFDRPTLPDSKYPEMIWTFLNGSPAYSPTGLSRKEQLIQTWVQVKRIDSLEAWTKLTASPVSRPNCANAALTILKTVPLRSRMFAPEFRF